MENEKVVVLLSAFNGEKYIRTQIDSILNQDVDCDVILIVRDDGSTDNTVSLLLDEYPQKNVVVITGSNSGSVASFFELLKYARDNVGGFCYYALSDQDDRWDPNKLQTGIDFIRKECAKGNHPCLYACPSRLVNEDLEPIYQKRKKRKRIDFYNSIIQNFLPGHTYIMNKELLDLVYDADISRIYVHDSFILNAAVLAHGLIVDDEPHADYRQHQENQLGATNCIPNWIVGRMARIKRGDGKSYSKQIEYICEKYYYMMNIDQTQEMQDFLNSRYKLIDRMHYIFKTKLYRQKKFENWAFKLFYLVGGYNQ